MSESTLPASAQATPKTQPAYRARGARNWPLWLGVLLVAFVFYLAVDGPNLAPRDPLQENFIVQHPVTGKFIKPPFPAFTMPGFPLGADQFGRDILSQLLWAVRPTLTMVLVVAALRLVVGTAMGLASGWSGRWVGRVLDVLISGALAAPVLFVALCVIAAFGIRWGVWAFILGLSITGWAEAARIIREQARSIKGQPYVEAARAVGASDVQLLIRHVLPQMMPLVWMLFSFEASSTLLTSAGLGFLGYFIHSVWIPLGDFTGIRATGRPELGQMLAAGTSADMQRQPWAMLAAGAMVFITVLGFNLLGEGLRLRLSLENLRRRKGLVVQVVDNAIEWAESRWFDPLSAWRRNLTTVAVLGSLLLLIFGGGWFLWQSQLAPQAQSAVAVPGGHQWAAAQHDAQGTLWTQVTGPADPSIAWVFTDQSGFTGGPAVAADGTVYVAAHSGTLYALNPDGAVLWQAELQRPPLGNPALGELGDVYVLDEANGLTAFTKEGRLRWDYESQTPAVPLASP
ncbi:MAG: ABC transporter permease subunit, partial [Anaerolineales bacterium]